MAVSPPVTPPSPRSPGSDQAAPATPDATPDATPSAPPPALAPHLLYPALYRAARVAARSRAAEVPRVFVGRGTRVYRNVSVGVGNWLAGANLARTIPAGKYSSAMNPANRWSGMTVDRTGGVGGLYATLDLDALTGEMFHYSLHVTLDADVRNVGLPAAERTAPPLTPTALGGALPGRRLFVYRLRERTGFADLSLEGGRRFLDDVWAADVVQDAAARTPYQSLRAAYDASEDHSFARGVCQGLWDGKPAVAGVHVTSVRTERATTLGQSGFNLVFLGKDGVQMDALVPERQISFVGRGYGLAGVTEQVFWYGTGARRGAM